MNLKISKFIIASLLLLMIPVSVFSNVMLTGSEELEVVDLGDGNIEVFINSQLINFEENVKSNLNLVYEIRRIDDLSLFYFSEQNFSLDISEVKIIEESFIVSDLTNGLYQFDIKVTSGSGAPLTFVQKEFVVQNAGENPMILFSTLPYLQIFYQYEDGRSRYEHSFSNTGKPIEPDSEFFVKFDLENLDESTQDVKINFNTRHSYDKKNVFELQKSLDVTLNASSINSFKIPLSMSDAGTYDLFVEIIKDDLIVSKREVRVVIGGFDGTIMDVFNLNDVYEKSQVANVEVQVVGPADGISIVQDVTLELNVLVDDIVVLSQEKNINTLSFSPEYFNFMFTAPVDLDFYKLHIILKKGDQIYDEIVLDYEELNPDLVINKDGKIYDPNAIMCLDDNVCSDIEKTLGNCMDCDLRLQEKDEELSNQINYSQVDTEELVEEPKEDLSILLALGLVISLIAIAGISIAAYHLNKRGK